MNFSFKETANNISKDSKSWMQQYEYSAPAEIERRRNSARGIKDFARTVLGLFVKPRLKTVESMYVFEGLRNKEYMSIFAPESVLVIGSHQEKDYAEAHGYGFCWSFPMVSATHSKMCRDWNIPIVSQIGYWVNELTRFKKVIFFLYEDTQPLGIFLVHLGRILKPKVTSVCIQHGYFGISHLELRRDGRLSDINFVWDNVQADLIGSGKDVTFEIGLPYLATAVSTSEIIVVLVGTGMPYDGNDDYEKSLSCFSDIYNKLSQSLGLRIFYRPHPNEWGHKKLISELRERFSLLDESNKLQRLNGPRAIFVGTISSLLYEAGVAGHLVAHLKLYDKITPVFNCDIEFGSANVDSFVEWVYSVRSSQCVDSPPQNISACSSLDLFIRALNSAKLINDDDVKKS